MSGSAASAAAAALDRARKRKAAASDGAPCKVPALETSPVARGDKVRRGGPGRGKKGPVSPRPVTEAQVAPDNNSQPVRRGGPGRGKKGKMRGGGVVGSATARVPKEKLTPHALALSKGNPKRLSSGVTPRETPLGRSLSSLEPKEVEDFLGVNGMMSRMRTRPLNYEEPIPVLVAGRDKELYELDSGAFYRWCLQAEELALAETEAGGITMAPRIQLKGAPEKRVIPAGDGVSHSGETTENLQIHFGTEKPDLKTHSFRPIQDE
ncbi:hypothetical protein CYMTET_31692, partial [Cymbomonas tetramitiformis]